jgi:hypothetical protein
MLWWLESVFGSDGKKVETRRLNEQGEVIEVQLVKKTAES